MEGIVGGDDESSDDEGDKESDSGEGSVDSDEPLAAIQKRLESEVSFIVSCVNLNLNLSMKKSYFGS